MKLSRPSRLIATIIVLISMLFMQLAVAGYACPGLKIGQVSESVTMEVDQAMVGCQGMDTMQPSLCQANDQAGNQSLDKPELPHVKAFVAATLTLVVHDVALIDTPITTHAESLLLTRTTAPPLSIRNCCFRI
ncbi:hypothetical protein QN360_07685 [Glaciimonas sp. CA11.2]|uniref:hypothetical protein n=1 Tax=unclassified Glaciimonas TaxID=2644401 RepID=UPI002AB36D33|nr:MULTISPECIES: hypothetical protein [unclassified Glaciimonas]MDY7544927.1 hypothetical protein [Glaciimonas sp. CA11.2]MEB0013228.1 hypothetical protein [Glaciimonas sp. Cout2]MEB0082531.1 hypothetical protein [Glaciimonas sp. Gout2]MEB0162785.1 hypothetical protein [Glaciimonas sp. CA11.2]